MNNDEIKFLVILLNDLQNIIEVLDNEIKKLKNIITDNLNSND